MNLLVKVWLKMVHGEMRRCLRVVLLTTARGEEELQGLSAAPWVTLSKALIFIVVVILNRSRLSRNSFKSCRCCIASKRGSRVRMSLLYTKLSTWKGARPACLSSTGRDSDLIDGWLQSWSPHPSRSGTVVHTVYPFVLSRFCKLAAVRKKRRSAVNSNRLQFLAVFERIICSHLPWCQHLWHPMPFRCR